MLICSLCVGDTLLTLVKVIPVEKDVEPVHLLTLKDLPTGQTADIECESENSALMYVAAFIAADEPEALDGYLDELRERLKDTSVFLP